MFSSWKEHKESICSCCGEHTKDRVRVSNDDGFCQSSYTVYVCKKHRKYLEVNTQVFVKVGGNLFHEFNADYGIFNCWEVVQSGEHYEDLRNKREIEFLSDVKFKY